VLASLTFGELVTILGLIGSGVAFFFAKPTVDALIRYGNWRMAIYREKVALKAQSRSLDEELNDKGHKYIIRRQDKRITELENAYTKSQAEAHHCREENAALKVELEGVKQDCRELRERIARLEGER
jgi:predicted nuclease with TOPRIM domain